MVGGDPDSGKRLPTKNSTLPDIRRPVNISADNKKHFNNDVVRTNPRSNSIKDRVISCVIQEGWTDGSEHIEGRRKLG